MYSRFLTITVVYWLLATGCWLLYGCANAVISRFDAGRRGRGLYTFLPVPRRSHPRERVP